MKIYEPGRAIYRKSKVVEKTCIFCEKKIIKKQQCASLEGKYWMVIVNKYPYMDGNVMIVSKRHLRDIADLSKEEWAEFHDVLSKTIKKLGKIFKTDDFNVGINIGIESGGSIEHMHWQIIPRKKSRINSANIFGNIEILTILPEDLRKIIDKK